MTGDFIWENEDVVGGGFAATNNIFQKDSEYPVISTEGRNLEVFTR